MDFPKYKNTTTFHAGPIFRERGQCVFKNIFALIRFTYVFEVFARVRKIIRFHHRIFGVFYLKRSETQIALVQNPKKETTKFKQMWCMVVSEIGILGFPKCWYRENIDSQRCSHNLCCISWNVLVIHTGSMGPDLVDLLSMWKSSKIHPQSIAISPKPSVRHFGIIKTHEIPYKYIK